MMDCLINFYKTLYSSKIYSEQNVKINLKKNKWIGKELPIVRECEKSTYEHMKNNKSPGQAGFIAQLYKIFRADIKDISV